MRIAYVTSEVHPFSKTGGLADVARSLPNALNATGIGTTVFSPLHRSVREWMAANAVDGDAIELPHTLSLAGAPHRFRFRRFTQHGTPYVFIEDDQLFDRAGLYIGEDGRDYPDNVVRFAFFCQAVSAYCATLAEPPAVMHVNDWQAALLPIYLKAAGGDTMRLSVRSVLTVHNLGYQGLFPREQLAAAGLGGNLFHPEALEFYGQINLLKGGIIFADAVTAVSPTYAKEIQTAKQGAGLHGVMQAQRHKLTGILNGIDVDEWNPKTDPRLPAHFDRTDLQGKASCKSALQWRMKVPVRPDAFLLGVVSRLDRQKGIHLIIEAMERLGDRDIQLVTLGTGARDLENRLRTLAGAQPDRVSVVIGFDESLAHLIEAGADGFLMPSAYEPCGLNQMYSQRYGTVPIVRETGGLRDTVVDYTAERLAAGQASGFTFGPLAVDSLVDAIRRAEQVYRSEPAAWRLLVTCIMGIDHSWQHSAREYAALYERVVADAGPS